MPERLTDKRLEPPIAHIRATIERIRQHEPAMADSLIRLLDAVTDRLTELQALRRVAEAAQRVHRRAERLDYAPDDQLAMRSQEWREAHRALGEALADWRRVREGEA